MLEFALPFLSQEHLSVSLAEDQRHWERAQELALKTTDPEPN
jgi:hypothetical protein|eukprot:COSAG06_NODE_31_length_31488_cov_60.882793_32_plen_42_part_00